MNPFYCAAMIWLNVTKTDVSRQSDQPSRNS